ncbi:phosphorylase family protein [Streptomyces sp. 4N124]|uniref:phosphorylase family protein n=1 Tax=Streptomyces sp. 4N124 TaxID=3457420 RepID=UPI003FD16E5E
MSGQARPVGTPHIGAAPGDVAPLVLMPGDPRRARRIAETFLEDARQVTDVRGVLGYAGTRQGVPMFALASGMGIPSMSIYATELFRTYGVRRIVRVSTAGAIPRSVSLRDVVIASAADAAELEPAAVHTGPVFSSDHFYLDRPALFDALERRGTLAVEMEAAGLYAVACAEDRERDFDRALRIAAAALLSDV